MNAVASRSLNTHNNSAIRYRMLHSSWIKYYYYYSYYSSSPVIKELFINLFESVEQCIIEATCNQDCDDYVRAHLECKPFSTSANVRSFTWHSFTHYVSFNPIMLCYRSSGINQRYVATDDSQRGFCFAFLFCFILLLFIADWQSKGKI
jgi:hypothetical protein